MTLLRGRVEVEESRSVVHPEFGPEAATFDARYSTGGRFVCFCRGVKIVNRTDNHLPPKQILTYPLSRVHTVILNKGKAGVWTLVAINPSDWASK